MGCSGFALNTVGIPCVHWVYIGYSVCTWSMLLMHSGYRWSATTGICYKKIFIFTPSIILDSIHRVYILSYIYYSSCNKCLWVQQYTWWLIDWYFNIGFYHVLLLLLLLQYYYNTTTILLLLMRLLTYYNCFWLRVVPPNINYLWYNPNVCHIIMYIMFISQCIMMQLLSWQILQLHVCVHNVEFDMKGSHLSEI